MTTNAATKPISSVALELARVLLEAVVAIQQDAARAGTVGDQSPTPADDAQSTKTERKTKFTLGPT